MCQKHNFTGERKEIFLKFHQSANVKTNADYPSTYFCWMDMVINIVLYKTLFRKIWHFHFSSAAIQLFIGLSVLLCDYIAKNGTTGLTRYISLDVNFLAVSNGCRDLATEENK